METCRAVQAHDWVRFQGLLEAQNRVNAIRFKGSWSLTFPLFGWVLDPIVEDTAATGPNSPWLTESLIAYTLVRQGQTEESSARYAALEKKYPRTRAVFEAAAEATLKGILTALAASDGKPVSAPSPHP